ncbi:MAG: hypothetical protein ACI4B3_08335 [Prevotella sp.]
MKRTASAVLLLLLTLAFANPATAKVKMVPKVYVFGFSASFKNAIIYITNVQEVDSAWVDTKTKFLCGRDQYSAQLKDHLTATSNDPHRTCVVMFSTKKNKLEKKYMKLKKMYAEKVKGKDGYEVHFIDNKDFYFSAVDMSPYLEELNVEKPKKEKKKEKRPEGKGRGIGNHRGQRH